ncbi:hypothetical protein IT568_13180, partial [bacterium]|nr:hypothetical protein [bacterium]
MKILVLLFILLQVSNSFAQKESLSFGLETDLTSSYLWNGISYNDGLINQSSVWVSTNDFTLTTWTNYVLKDFDDRNKTNEIDLILAYEKEFGAITFEPSLLLYTYPKQTNPTTAEFSLLLTYPLENFDVFTSFTSDFLEYKGTFYNTSGVAFEKELS